MIRKVLLGLAAVSLLIVLFVVLITRMSGSPFRAEMRIVSRERMSRFQETTIHKLPFPEFVSRVHELVPNWHVGFRDQMVTFTSPDGSRSYWVSPGTYNPDSEWTDLGSSENWSTLFLSRPSTLMDWLAPQKKTTGTMVVDCPLLYWGKSDRFGFALKLDKLPSWLSEIYSQRTGIKPRPDAKVGAN